MNKKIALVVIPTYNEKGSIGKMIDTLCGNVFKKISKWDCHLLIVDDTSPDKTYEVVQKMGKKYSKLHLLLNPKKMGIGNAYTKGFIYGMEKLKADVLIEIDADFQHPPELIITLLDEIDKGNDYILGSRDIKGGEIPKGWGFKRIFYNKIGGLLARVILFFPSKYFFKVTDPTTGLKASRVKGFVDKMNFDNLHSLKFGYKIDYLFQMVILGAKVKEIPLKFNIRTEGKSKIASDTAVDILKTAVMLRMENFCLKLNK